MPGNKSAVRFDASERIHEPSQGETRPGNGTELGSSPEGSIGSMDDLMARLADAEAKLSHVKEYL